VVATKALKKNCFSGMCTLSPNKTPSSVNWMVYKKTKMKTAVKDVHNHQ